MNHKTKPYLLILLLLISVSVSACSYISRIPVVSTPPGAKVLMDGKDTGEITPAGLLLWKIPLGEHNITVQKEGYATPPPEDFKVIVAKAKILATIIIPEICVPQELFGRRWKHALPHNSRRSILREGFTFELEPVLVPPRIVGRGDGE